MFEISFPVQEETTPLDFGEGFCRVSAVSLRGQVATSEAQSVNLVRDPEILAPLPPQSSAPGQRAPDLSVLMETSPLSHAQEVLSQLACVTGLVRA